MGNALLEITMLSLKMSSESKTHVFVKARYIAIEFGGNIVKIYLSYTEFIEKNIAFSF